MPDRRTTFATLATRQRQIAANALANEATGVAAEALRLAGPAAAVLVLADYATPYGQLLAAGARPPRRPRLRAPRWWADAPRES